MIRRSIRPDRPVDPVTLDILRAIADDTRAEGTDSMLVGATARDILLTHVFGFAPRSATYDVDFAVAVRDWHQFDALRARLVARGTFRASARTPQCLYYQRAAGAPEYRLDLVPFGAIAQASNEVVWPPDMAVVMNVAGYDDALRAAEFVEFAPGFEGRVVSLPGLAILKLVAWSDRGRENPKDAHDLIHLMDHYTAAGNIDRVYEEEGVIDAADYDPDLAGACLLGRDIKRVASAATLEVLKTIIDDDTGALSAEMMKSLRFIDNVQERVASRLRLFREALE